LGTVVYGEGLDGNGMGDGDASRTVGVNRSESLATAVGKLWRSRQSME
jgi:hypothetical protein